METAACRSDVYELIWEMSDRGRQQSDKERILFQTELILYLQSLACDGLSPRRPILCSCCCNSRSGYYFQGWKSHKAITRWHTTTRLVLSGILKFSKASLWVSKVPSRTRGGGVVKILRKVGVPFFFKSLLHKQPKQGVVDSPQVCSNQGISCIEMAE